MYLMVDRNIAVNYKISNREMSCLLLVNLNTKFHHGEEISYNLLLYETQCFLLMRGFFLYKRVSIEFLFRIEVLCLG